MRRLSLITAITLGLLGTISAEASTYTKTKYPIVLAHGMGGFDSLFGIKDYWFGIQSDLAEGGADVYATHVSSFNSTEVRNEQFLQQVEEIIAITGAEKVNLIGHSQGGYDVRYVAAVRPDLVASVTTIASPHHGAEAADFLLENLEEGSFSEAVVTTFVDKLGVILALLAGEQRPQDSAAGLHSVSTVGAAEFASFYPAGMPTEACGEGVYINEGIHLFSWSGISPFTNALDPLDIPLKIASLKYSEPNDGLVGQCSSHFGRVLRDDYHWNHTDEVNQVLGLSNLFEVNARSVVRAHANRLKNLGL